MWVGKQKLWVIPIHLGERPKSVVISVSINYFQLETKQTKSSLTRFVKMLRHSFLEESDTTSIIVWEIG